MKKSFRILTCVSLLLASLFTVSCSEEDTTQYATSGTFGEITVKDRSKIGTHQWFTLAGTYTSGQNVNSEELTVTVNGSVAQAVAREGENFSFETYLSKPGKHAFKFEAVNSGIFQDGSNWQNVEKIKEVEVVPSDIRCHFWYDTREETVRNLARYKTVREIEGGLAVSEEDIYGDVSYSSEAHWDLQSSISSVSSLDAQRTVNYLFDSSNRLNAINYICFTKNQSPNTHVAEMLGRVVHMMDEYDFVEFKYTVSNSTLTAEETAKVEACVKQLNTWEFTDGDMDKDGAIGKLIEEKGLMLIATFLSVDQKTKGAVGTFYQDGKYSVIVTFNPVN